MLLDPLPGPVCHPAAPLLQESRRRRKTENNINSQEATASDVHHLLAQSLLYHHCFFRSRTMLTCFLFSAPPPPNHQRPTRRNFSPLSRPKHLVLFRAVARLAASCCTRSQSPPPPTLTITRYSKEHCQPRSHRFSLCLWRSGSGEPGNYHKQTLLRDIHVSLTRVSRSAIKV